MRVIAIVKASKESEASVMPTTEQLAEMGQFNEALVNAGIMLAGDGLRASSKGVRIHYSGDQRNIESGPFANPESLIAGYWVWQVKSMDEAVEWAKRVPFQSGEVELREFSEAEDFGEAFTPELREQEDRLRARAEGQQ
jgi:hypothetical protein